MTQTQFSSSIASRPTYAQLQSHGGTPAILMADAEGIPALVDLVSRDSSVLDKSQVVLVSSRPLDGEQLRRQGRQTFVRGISFAEVRGQFNRMLVSARMGTRLYLAGDEGFIGQAAAQALEAGVPEDAIQAEHRGSIARRMQCVHCKGITENVVTDPFVCDHCGLTLFVRDHFSRRLGAFQGVCVDAETPGEIPETQEIQL